MCAALWRLAGVVLQLTKALAHGSATAAGSSALHSPRIASTTGGSSGWEAVGRREGIAAQGRGSGWLSGLQLHSLLAEEWSLCVFCAAALVSHCCLRWMTGELVGREPIFSVGMHECAVEGRFTWLLVVMGCGVRNGKHAW